MSFGECLEPDPDCKYFSRAPVPGGNTENGCFSDKHHTYGRPPSGTARKFALRQTEQLCRQEHEEIHAVEGVVELPSLEVMRQAIRDIGIQDKLIEG